MQVFLVCCLVLIIITVILSNPNNSPLRCGFKRTIKIAKFHLTSTCTKSNMKIVGSRKLASMQSCIQLAYKRRAFAFNYAHKKILHSEAGNFSDNTCIIYDCPELELINKPDETSSSPYDYYSFYANITLQKLTSSCVPGVGVFHLHKRRTSYRDAKSKCAAMGGRLADILTEYKTSTIMQLAMKSGLNQAYIGLDQLSGIPNQFVSSTGKIVNCESWRAWGPGEPRESSGPSCGAISPSKGWMAKPCTDKLPFICELLPTGPLRPCRHIQKRRAKKLCIRKYTKTLPGPNRYPKCGAPKPK